MHTYVRRALQTALVSGGLLAAGAVAAQATPHDGALGVDVVVGSTTQPLVALSVGLGGEPTAAAGGAPLVAAPVTVPVDVSGVAVAVLGDANVASAAPAGGQAAAVPEAPVASPEALVAAPVTVPVDVSGVAVAVLGDATVGSAAPAGGAGAGGAASDPVMAPEVPVPAPGSLVSAPVEVPVDVSGVAVAVLGDASVTSAGPAGGDEVSGGPAEGDGSGAAGPIPGVVSVPVTVPVDVSGVALGVLGDADVTQGRTDGGTDASVPGEPTEPAGDGAAVGAEGPLVDAPVSVPVTVSGVALGVLGDATVSREAAGAAGGTDTGGGTDTDAGTPGTPGADTPGMPGAGTPGGGSVVEPTAPGVVTPSEGVLGAGEEAPGGTSDGSGAGVAMSAGGGSLGTDRADATSAEQVALARSATGAGRSAALATRAADVRPVAALADTGSELWLVPVALALLVGGVWLRGRAHRAANHPPARIAFVPHQRGASDRS
ncbi:hypothetical protein ACWFNE_10320 [Cellulomonas sp. NPDC055163]